MSGMTDPVVEANVALLRKRSEAGIRKYGTTLERGDLTHRDWLQHALEETLDLANYLQRTIRLLDAQGDDGK